MIIFFSIGDDWECTLGDKTEVPPLNNDGDNVYGVNNLSYLQQQLNNYGTDEDRVDESHEDDYFDDSEGGGNKTTNNDDEESSGDGAPSGTQIKHDSLPIPSNLDPNGLVSTHLQRLSQLIQNLNKERNYTIDLGPDDLNQFLASHKIKVQKGVIKGTSSVPMPSNGKIPATHLQQILELQNQLKKLASTRDSYSTPPTPVKNIYSGSGYYNPADATTIHIKATNAVKSPRFPDVGLSTSQIVVNRPEGSVVFTLPSANVEHLPNHKEPGISEETLKTLLQLSKQMSTTNQPPSIPPFLPPSPTSPLIQPIIRPIYYPFHQFPVPALSPAPHYEDQLKNNRRQEDKTMQKISSVSGQLDNEANSNPGENDVGQTTIIHNHVPITISNPSPTNAIVTRYHGTVSTTQRPYMQEEPQYDSYGNKRPYMQEEPQYDSHGNKRPSISIVNNYDSFPPYNNNMNRPVPQPYGTVPTIHNPNPNNLIEPPQAFVQLTQVRPTEPVSYNPPAYVNNHPTANYNIANSPGYSPTIYTPSPHLSNVNVNKYVNVDHKPFPTNQPPDYIPVASGSQHNLNYINTPSTYLHQTQTFKNDNEPNMIYPTAQQLPLHSEFGGFETINDNLEENYGDEENGGNEDENDSDDEEDNDDSDFSNESSNFNSDQNSVNDENVMNILANYNNENSQQPSNHVQKKPLFEYSPSPSDNHKQFVSIGGNFISLDTYQNTIEPYLTENAISSANIQVLTCATGVRQANNTDCTRYFVCNSKTGKVLSYACPPYTAFDSSTKICNAKTYSECHPEALNNRFTIIGNKRIQQEAQNALAEANKVKHEALKAQQLAHLIKLETQKILNSAAGSIKFNKKNPSGAKATSAPAIPVHISHHSQNLRPSQTKKKPSKVYGTVKTPQKGKKRKVPCRTEGKLPDQLSRFNYFICFKGPDGKMRARKLTCPSKLIFCPRNKVCTSLRRCLAKKN